MLRCRGLEKSYGELRAVDGVDLDIAPGETYGLLGPNGAGKTTTISIVCGLLHADDGTVTVLGEPMRPDAAPVRRHLGLVPQEVALYPDLTARENLAFFGRLHNLDRGRRKRRVREVLEVTGLSDRADDRVGEFSGGMKRRLNIGVGLLHEPRLLVLDEPTVGVDPQSRNAILEAVERLAGTGLAVLYTTHYMEEAQRLCDRIGILDRGRLRAEGAHRELVATVGERDHVTLELAGGAEAAASACAGVAGVSSADAAGGRVVCVVDDAVGRLPEIIAATVAAGVTVTGIDVDEPDLEDVFLHLTGRGLRD